ncbi:hypothetical protein CMV30_15165 [Nibricoccus aquaticus]|uniref:Uncharacterized protein n=1 Tax=Nibricoccus aquaticus TaxID=2576891 RepID=A0A290QFY6_9BACT|nr:hypothetical protein [Nibricoccus aquaticus]ATC65186.1 hypothetical protein CMV30_15165 [Nibricoccus aquaticus]
MSTISTRFETIAHVAAPAPAPSVSQELSERLNSLYALSQRSHYIFGSPLGPFYHKAHHLSLPRFVYFGPHTHDESLRLAFYAGHEHDDLRSTFALLHLVERLAIAPDIGQGLNLSFFPLLDAAGLFHGETGRDLAQENWAHSFAPEINLLQKDARSRGYHGFVRVLTATGTDEIAVSLRSQFPAALQAPGVEFISSDDFDPLPVRWESASPLINDGPLTLNDDLPFSAFELTLRIPAAWSAELYREAVSSILRRFILRYRTLQAYGQHL